MELHKEIEQEIREQITSLAKTLISKKLNKVELIVLTSAALVTAKYAPEALHDLNVDEFIDKFQEGTRPVLDEFKSLFE